VSTGTDQADQADQADGAGRRCTVPDCAERHVARGYCRPHYVRWRRHGDPHAEVPVAHRVRGAVSYWSTHQRVRAQRGPATAQRCAQCHAPAAVWSYDGTDPDERTDSTRGRRYSLDPGRYRPRCRSCPSGLDAARAARLYRAGASARGIGALMHVGRGAVLAVLRAHGVPIRRSGHRP